MSEIGRTAYEAFYAGLPQDTWGPWEEERPDTRAIWARIERAVRVDAEAENERLRAAVDLARSRLTAIRNGEAFQPHLHAAAGLNEINDLLASA